MEPANSIIKKLGGARKCAEICGITKANVYRWMRDTDNDGTGGLIQMQHAVKLLEESERLDLGLTEADFFPPKENVEGDHA